MRQTLTLVLVAGCILATPLYAQKSKKKHPLIEEFIKYFKTGDHFARRDQVERLARLQTVEAVDLLIRRGLMDAEDIVREKASWALGQMRKREAREAVLAGLNHGKVKIRRGVAIALGHAKDGPSPVQPLGRVLVEDGSPVVRVAAAQAMGMLKSREAVAPLTQALADRSHEVIIAACDSLALITSKTPAPSIIGLLDHPNWRVQVAALNALGRIRARESIAPIIKYLAEARGRPRMDARRALVRITQRTFGMGAKMWQEWWARMEKGEWKVPPEKSESKKQVPVADEDPGRGYSRKPLKYHRITTYSKKLLFVLDISASMFSPILVARGRDTGNRELGNIATDKIKLAREELAFALRGLEKNSKFNIVVFETNVRAYKKQAIVASASNVQAAIRWVERQKPRGGGSSRSKRSSGRDSEGRLVGRTNTYAALRTIFGLPAKGRGGVTPGSGKKRKVLWDTCFFLTDGEPTEGEYLKSVQILSEVRRWNKIYRVQINCIGMNATGSMRDLLDGLARMTGGKAVYLGK